MSGDAKRWTPDEPQIGDELVAWRKRAGLSIHSAMKRLHARNWGVRNGRIYDREDDVRALERLRSTLPSAPCVRCGARGLCGHDGRLAA